MSATRSRSQIAATAGRPAATPSPTAAAGRPRLLTVVAALAAAWSLALLAMVLWISNPSTVSRDQILKADAVVIARRISPENVRVERVFHGDLAEGDEIAVLNLDEVKEMTRGQDYIVPLSVVRQDFVVTKLEGQRTAPLVYATSAGRIEEIKSILRDHL